MIKRIALSLYSPKTPNIEINLRSELKLKVIQIFSIMKCYVLLKLVRGMCNLKVAVELADQSEQFANANGQRENKTISLF